MKTALQAKAALQAFWSSARRWDAVRVAWIALALWAAGLAYACTQLDGWRRELTFTLMQLSADSQFRHRLAQKREAIEPAWYRQKALTLLSATDRMRQHAAWTLFIPGSWRIFDDLEERVAERIEREFNEIVVETIQLELLAKAAALTGVPPTLSAKVSHDCRTPPPDLSQRRLSAATEDLPEYTALSEFVRQTQKLDEALRAFLDLQQPGRADLGKLALVVKYTLGSELPPNAQRSLSMFQAAADAKQTELLRTRLQETTRCTLFKGVASLHARLLQSNDLLTLEHSYQDRSRDLFLVNAQAAPFDRTLERYRAVAALLQDQDALLSRGGNEWMREQELKLGPAYDEMIGRVGTMTLFGPEVLTQVQQRSGRAFVEFRKEFENRFGGTEAPGIEWRPQEKRFALSAERLALKESLVELLRQPFIMEPPGKPANDNLAKALEQAESLANARRQFADTSLAALPTGPRTALARVVDARVGDLVYQRAYRALQAAAPTDASQPLDLNAYRDRTAHVQKARMLLMEMGANGLPDRLLQAHTGVLLRRLTAMQEEARRLLVEAAAVPPAPQVTLTSTSEAPADGAAAQPPRPAAEPSADRSLERKQRLHTLAREAATLLPLVDPSIAAEPVVVSWQKLVADLETAAAAPSLKQP